MVILLYMITGFPSPAQGYEDGPIDLNKILVRHPAATILMEIQTNRYARAGIFMNDLVIIDRSLTPSTKNIIVYEENGEFHIGKMEKLKGELIVFGVVVSIIHNTLKDVNNYDSSC